MPKIKVPKHSPSIDMTPMVDLAFLLVTFFMLAANFRSDEPVQVETPSSISDKLIPENVLLVTIDPIGRVFLNLKDPDARKEMLQNMSNAYKINFSKEQYEKFGSMESFGCTMQELPQYINMSAEERKAVPTKGIPSDTTQGAANQLKDWVYYGNIAAINTANTKFNEAKLRGENLNMAELKPKFVLKVDGKALYISAQNVIDVFRDLELNNMNFITSLEQAPK